MLNYRVAQDLRRHPKVIFRTSFSGLGVPPKANDNGEADGCCQRQGRNQYGYHRAAPAPAPALLGC